MRKESHLTNEKTKALPWLGHVARFPTYFTIKDSGGKKNSENTGLLAGCQDCRRYTWSQGVSILKRRVIEEALSMWEDLRKPCPLVSMLWAWNFKPFFAMWRQCLYAMAVFGCLELPSHSHASSAKWVFMYEFYGEFSRVQHTLCDFFSSLGLLIASEYEIEKICLLFSEVWFWSTEPGVQTWAVKRNEEQALFSAKWQSRERHH